MTITRDADYPPEVAALFSAFNGCAEGYASEQVVEAAFNLLVCAINFHSGAQEPAVAFATELADVLVEHVSDQWTRERDPTDVVVPNAN